MTITIELAPDLQAELARQAATQGVGIDAYAAGLLEDAAYRSQSSPPSGDVLEAIERKDSRTLARRYDDPRIAPRVASLTGIVVLHPVTLSWCFPDEQTHMSVSVLDRLKAGERALVPAPPASR